MAHVAPVRHLRQGPPRPARKESLCDAYRLLSRGRPTPICLFDNMKVLMFRFALLAWLVLGCTAPAPAIELRQETRDQYRRYLQSVEKDLTTRKHFLNLDAAAGMRERVRGGHVYIQERRPQNEPPGGLIHHWEGAVFVPNAKVNDVIKLVQNYDGHKSIYSPEVNESQTLERKGNSFRIRLRLLTKKIVTVLLETEHKVEYRQLDPQRWESSSNSLKVAEVDDNKELPPGTGHGFVWSMDSYWRFLEADGGVYLECTSVSLSRDIPFGMSRIIRPIIENFPEDSLRKVLAKTRDAMKTSASAGVVELGTQAP